MAESATSLEWVRSLRVGRQLVFGLLALVGAALVVMVAGGTTFTLPVFWAFGLGYGFVLQRSRFCFAASFRDLFLLQDGRVMKGILGGMAVASVGFTLVMFSISPNLSVGRFPFMASLAPVGPHLLLAGIAFGMGMVIAGGCFSGTFYRIGEGYVASLVSLGGIVLGLALLLHTWNWWWGVTLSQQSRVWLPHSLGWSGALVATLLSILVLYLLVLWWESRGGVIARRPVEEVSGVGFGERMGSLWRGVFVKAWPASLAGLLLGTMNVFEYLFQRPWGLTGETSRWADALLRWVSLPPGELRGISEGLGACGLAASESLITDGLMLNVGLVFGSFIAALIAGEFKLRFPRQKRRYLQALIGGTMMGYSAGLALGCNIGGFFSAIPSLGLNGWVFGLGLVGGAYLGVQVIKRIG